MLHVISSHLRYFDSAFDSSGQGSFESYYIDEEISSIFIFRSIHIPANQNGFEDELQDFELQLDEANFLLRTTTSILAKTHYVENSCSYLSLIICRWGFRRPPDCTRYYANLPNWMLISRPVVLCRQLILPSIDSSQQVLLEYHSSIKNSESWS